AVFLHDVALEMNDQDNGEVLADLEAAIVAVANEPGQHALAVTERRIGAEIARAADRAIAQIPPVAGEAPIGGFGRLLGHGTCGHWRDRSIGFFDEASAGAGRKPRNCRLSLAPILLKLRCLARRGL